MYIHLKDIEEATGIKRAKLYRMIKQGRLKASFTPYGWYKVSISEGNNFINSAKNEAVNMESNFLRQVRLKSKEIRRHKSLSTLCQGYGRDRVLHAFEAYGLMLYVQYYAIAHSVRMQDLLEAEHLTYERNISRLNNLFISDSNAIDRALQYALDFSLASDHETNDIINHVLAFCRMSTRTAFLTAHAGNSPL